MSLVDSQEDQEVVGGTSADYSSDNNHFTEGVYALVQRGEQERVIEFRSTEVIQYGRGNQQQTIELKNVLGKPNYTCFRFKPHASDDGKPQPQNKIKYYLEALDDYDKLSLEQFDVTERGKDNRDIFDDNKSQKMNAYDIQELKDKGASGSEILENLILNSATFTRKTEYAQEKYVKKKEKTYGDTLLFIKPTLSIVADYYFKRDPTKILNMRPDTLSQILSYANVHANGQYLVYETGCSGLVVAAVLARLRGTGLVLHVHAGSSPQRQAVNYLNLTIKEMQPLKSLDVFYLIRPGNPSKKELAEAADALKQESVDGEVPCKKQKLDGANADSKSSAEPARAPMSVNRYENERSKTILDTTEFTSLIIAGKEHPLSILQRLLPRLASSAPIVIFSQLVEPLGDCYTWLKEKNQAVNIHLIENWLRNIQVEPERTHPEINMSSTGGYFLIATSIS